MDIRPAVCAAILLACVPLRAADAPPSRPLHEVPYTPSLDLSALDRGQDPCVDFYAFACGGWMKRNPIPSDQANWHVYSKLHNDNLQFLWGLLEQAAQERAPRTPVEQKVGAYFAACMDEAAIERAGLDPLRPTLAALAALQDKRGLAAWLGGLHLEADDSGLLFGFSSEQDMHASSQVIAYVGAGGLGLPDRDYYIKDDEASRNLRAKYRAHVERVFVLLGEPAPAAATAAESVLRIETALAQHSLTRVERRDPRRLDHPMSAAELQALTPSFRWDDYFAALGLARPAKLNVNEPEFMREVEALLGRESLAAVKTYLRWHVAYAFAQYLSASFVEAHFDFYGRTLHGAEQLPPRWKRCVRLADAHLGEALGQVFVARTFPPERKAAVLDMVQRIEQAMEARLRTLAWMGPVTRREALAKLHGMRNKIGYPDHWRDYTALRIERGDFLGNVRRGQEFELRRRLAKIGQPLDRGEWEMTPPTVNAYYHPLMNDMNFPAGVLQPPLYDARLDDAPNYGNTGGTIGHELIHGFDDEGRRFDAQGNLRDWWSEDDARAFEARARCIADQYAQYTVIDDIKINSRLTLGEDVADLAGLILAWDAWKGAIAGQTLQPRDDFTPEQRFFIGFAQWTCENTRDETKRLNAVTNPHSPGVWRINGVVVNMPEFAQAFGCRPGQPMVKPADQVCRVW